MPCVAFSDVETDSELSMKLWPEALASVIAVSSNAQYETPLISAL
jgi:hypothetical protein